MGTYDTRGGTPISPPDEEQPSSPLEDAVMGLLEDAGFSTEVSDRILELIHAEEVRLADKNYDDDDYGGGGDPMHDVEFPFAKNH